MYKRSSQGWLKHIDFILWDVVILQAAFILGYMIRHGWGQYPYSLQEYRSLAVILIVADFLVSAIFNTMHNVVKRGYGKEFSASAKQAFFVLVIMSLYLFSTQTSDIYSRITIYLTAGFHLLLGYLFRLLWKQLIRKLNRNKAKTSMILIADENSVEKILAKKDELDQMEYKGLVLSNRDAEGEIIQGLKVVANLSNAADYICRGWVDEVFVYPERLSDLKESFTASYEAVEDFIVDTYGTQRISQLRVKEIREAEESGKNGSLRAENSVGELISQCREMGLPVHIRLPISSVGGKSFIEKVGGYNVLTTTANYAEPWQLALKRVLDIIGGVFGSIAALIVIAIVGPKIRRESPGPVLFRQTRIGLNGKRFTFYKIRSMNVGAEEQKVELAKQNRVQDERMFKLDFDPRIIGNKVVDGKQVTGIGEKIRRSSLDEFPQFFNVLKGDMSLVGTRPPTEDEWEKYQYHHRARLACKPGITGLWQVSGRSKITDFEEVIRLDTEYIDNWSLSLDLRILVKTVKTVIKREGAM